MLPSLPRPAGRRTLHRQVAATAAAVATAAFAAATAHAAPPGVVDLGPVESVTDMAPLRDGSVGIAAGGQDGRLWKTTTFRLSAGGLLGAPSVVDRRSVYAEGTFGPGGELALLQQPHRTEGRSASVVLRDVSAAGTWVGPPTTFRAAKRREIAGEQPLVGPTGAVAVLLNETTTTGRRLSLAFRPAGTATFSAPQRLRATTRRQAKRTDQTTDGIDTTFDVALDGAGGGAVLALPESRSAGAPYVRRVSPTGQLGPRIDLGIAASSATTGALAFDEAGRLDLAVASWTSGSPTYATGGHVYASSLAAGSDVASPPQDLTAVGDDVANLVLHLAATAGRTAVLIGTQMQADLRLFEGAGPLSEVAATRVGWREVGMHAIPGGGLLFTWEDNQKQAGVYASARAPDGVFSVPKRLTPDPPAGGYERLRGLAVMGDGRVALAWTESTLSGSRDRTYATIATP